VFTIKVAAYTHSELERLNFHLNFDQEVPFLLVTYSHYFKTLDGHPRFIMKKYFFFLLLFLTAYIPSISQATDSLKTDSLENQLLELSNYANEVYLINFAKDEYGWKSEPG
jgi:hypothetical protein